MRVTKPNISHISDTVFEQNARLLIATLDIIDNVLATGSDDSKIKIWNLDVLLRNEFQSPKVLTYHHSSIVYLCFLDKDTLLSCSFDGMLAVWFDFQVVGSASNQFVPHSISLSSDKSLVAVSNINGDCNIYKMNKSPILVATIHLDVSIKSVCFDPLMQFIALLTTKELAIYDITHMDQPQLVQSFKKQIDKSSEYYALKLSYSPDGQLLAVPNCINTKLPVCLLISRDYQESSLVGLVSAPTQTAFSPKLYRNNNTINSLLAVVSSDSVISLWISTSYKPLLIIKEVLFDDEISDLRWHNDGLILTASSVDGSVVLLSFNEQELGTPLTSEETVHYLRQQGISKVSSAPISLKEIEYMNTPVPTIQKVPLHQPKQSLQPQALQPPQQIESVTKDGKRRIQPITKPIIQPNTQGPTMVPIYDVILKQDSKVILTPIKEQLSVIINNTIYSVANNTPDKSYATLSLKSAKDQMTRIIETDDIYYISSISDKYIMTLSTSNELIVYSLCFMQLTLPILFDSQIFCCCQDGQKLAFLTQRGNIDLYTISHDYTELLSLELQCDVTPVLRSSQENIIQMAIINNDTITVQTNKSNFIYNKRLSKWMRSSGSKMEIMNDRYLIKNEQELRMVLNAEGIIKSEATRCYLEVT